MISQTSEIKEFGATIQLTKDEANLFMIFRQYQLIWEKVFVPETKNCKCELSFDNNGMLRSATIPKTYNA